MKEVEQIFNNLIARYSDDARRNKTLWQEIEENYTSVQRYYHNLEHIRNMIQELEEVKSYIFNFDILLFSVFYHDIIYRAGSTKNEEQSAQIAKARLNAIHLSRANITKIEAQILATKKHHRNSEADTNFLIDADLAILGKSWEMYQEYFKNIRLEYALYPDFLYKPGRKKVLKHFLESEELFKTAFFKNKYEDQARLNLLKEIEVL